MSLWVTNSLKAKTQKIDKQWSESACVSQVQDFNKILKTEQGILLSCHPHWKMKAPLTSQMLFGIWLNTKGGKFLMTCMHHYQDSPQAFFADVELLTEVSGIYWDWRWQSATAAIFLGDLPAFVQPEWLPLFGELIFKTFSQTFEFETC